MFKKILIILSLFSVSFLLFSVTYAQESVTITTYYPSPYGSYNELHTNQMAIGAGYQTTTPPNNSLIVEGNVGIGTTTPQTTVHVQTSNVSGNATFLVRNSNTAGKAQIQLDDATEGASAFNNGGWVTFCGSTSGGACIGGSNVLQLWNSRSGNLVFGTENIERMRITSGGNIGIGTTTPTQSLDVNGNVNISGNLSAAGTLHSFATNGYQGLPSGLIIQWGRYTTTTDNDQNFAFPIAFPNACFNVQTTPTGNTNAYTTRVVSTTVSGFIANRNNNIDNNADFYWFAVGY